MCLSRADVDMADSDEDLLTRIQAGEHDLFGTLIRRYERELYGYLRRYLGDAELAADVFQNTWMQVFVKIEQYQLGRAARPWLYTIATNQGIDAMRRRGRRIDSRTSYQPKNDAEADDHRAIYEQFPDRGDGPVERAELDETRWEVRDAVDQLPELLRHVVILAYFQGLRYQEIADALKIPLGTVKSRLNAALTKLTDVWTTAHPPDDLG